MGLTTAAKPQYGSGGNLTPNPLDTRPGHKGQLAKRKAKNRIMDEIRFQSRKGNR